MKKLIKALLSVSLTTTCFAADQAAEWDYLQPNYTSRFTRFTHASDAISSSIVQRFTHAVRFAEDIFTTSAAAGAGAGAGDGAPPRHSILRNSDLLPELPRLDYLLSHRQYLTLKTFQVFLNERTAADAASVLLASFLQQHFTGETLNLTSIIAGYEGTPALELSTKSYAVQVLGTAIDGYWKYLSSTIKQHCILKQFCIFKEQSRSGEFYSTKLKNAIEQNGVNEIAQVLGATASLRLEYMRDQQKHLSPATMASRLLTNHVNDLAQEHGFRQKLEFNHDWGINFGVALMDNILGNLTLLYTGDLDNFIIYLAPHEGFGEDFYRQQSQNYYRSYPILRQVRLNPNGLPRDVERQFRRYFRGMYQQSLKQLR